MLKNEQYIAELKELENKMIAAESFALKFPCFEKYILEHKITGEGFVNFDGRYKDMYLNWGICRSYHETAKRLNNCKYKHKNINRYLSSIYVNTICHYDRHEKFGLYEAMEGCNIYYTDHNNTTFYVEDEHLVDFLDALNNWHLTAKALARKLTETEKIEKLEGELRRLKK